MKESIKSIFRFDPELAKLLHKVQKKLEESERREQEAFELMREKRLSVDPRPASKRPSGGPNK
jgi:hypothetical protein